MKKLLLLALPLLVLFSCTLAVAQKSVPTCNSFDALGNPIYTSPTQPPQTGTTLCTDFFGKGNYANSPLPSGPIDPLGFTILSGGYGYMGGGNGTLPVTISDALVIPAGLASCTATVTAGAVTAISSCTPGSGYVAPIVDPIADVPPSTGSGAWVLAKLDVTQVVGGIHKFVNPFFDLKRALAAPDTATFPGADYYEIALVETTAQMHSDLPATTVRGYVQVYPTATNTAPLSAANVCAAAASATYNYLGPVILAQKNRPVRVKFTNCLPAGAGGDLFIPVDTTYMGAGTSPTSPSTANCSAVYGDANRATCYAQNRATLHLHGGNTPWISDGTPHQWTAPAGETQGPSRGVSTQMVPDMWFDPSSGALMSSCAGQNTCSGGSTDPGPGSMTFYWTNEQGGRLMFYHDHAYGLTRLNVYAGEAAGYLLVDPAEEDALAALTVPGTINTTVPDLGHLIPLVIQDKTFVPSAAQLTGQDPTWIWGTGNASGVNGPGDLWFPHVYMPNQNPADAGAANAFGRWDYGAWFFPPMTTLTAASPNTAVTIPCTSSAFPNQILAPAAANNNLEGCPITPNPSGTPEGFMDTPVINGVAYPVLHVAPEAYRFRILSAGNDRSLNLQLYLADATGKEVPMLPSVPPATGTAMPLCGAINWPTFPPLGIGLPAAILDASGNPINGTGLPANCWPSYGTPSPGIPSKQFMWPADGRDGGVPDPRYAGPPFIQIGSEGGLLPAPVVIPSTPVGYEYNTRSITITNVSTHGLWLGPAERADVVVDFSQVPAKCAALGVSPCTLILYNDAPTPAPAFDMRLDYYTGDLDESMTGGAPTTLPGYGPNTRTLMQIVVDAPSTGAAPFSLPTLKPGLAAIFKATQATPVVPEPTYPVASGGNSSTATYGRISDNTITWTPVGATTPTTYTYDQKAIQELFTLDYGRMNATLGVEIPMTNFLTQTTIPYGYAEWPTEVIQDGQQQLWKITHNGVDTHFIHFHLFNVQVVNRIGWDGTVRPPDQNELGWKDTVRMNPLEDIVVAVNPITPTFPFPVPDSIRSLDVTMPDSNPSPAISGIDPSNGNAGITTINNKVNFGWEYVWHCHILGHEENDMMRPIIYQVAPPAPSSLSAVLVSADGVNGTVTLTWTDNSASETSFQVQRATDSGFTQFTPLPDAPASSPSPTSYGGQITTTDSVAAINTTTYFYRVRAVDNVPANPNPLPAPWQTQVLYSQWSNVASAPPATAVPPAVTFTGAPASAAYGSTFTVAATTNANVMPAITTTGACSVGAVTGVPSSATAVVTMTSGTGSCTLTANWPPSTFFLAAQAQQTTNATLAPLTITASSATVVYGGVVPAITPSYSGFVNGDTAVTALGTAPTCSTTATSTSAIGTYPTTCSGALAPNYSITYVAGAVTIGQATLTITANSASMTYGGAVPAITPNFAGFINGDTNLTALTTQPTCTTNATSTSAVSGNPTPTYSSTCSGAVAPNYTIVYVAGVVTINPATLTVTASSATMTYGGTVPTITPSYSGWVNGQGPSLLTSLPTCTTNATNTSPVSGNPYSSTCTGGAAPNYTLSYVPGTVTINGAPLTIAANNQTKTYGQALTLGTTAFSVTAGTLLNGDTITGVTLTSTGAAATATVSGSPYPIVPSAAVGTGADNYTITYVNGSLTVTPAALTITVNNLTKVYGATLTFAGTEFTATGLANGNTVTSVTLTSAGTPATAAVATYAIVPSAAVGSGLGNYSITYVNGALSVTKATTTTAITANLPNPSNYGQPVTISFSVTPQVSGIPTGSVTIRASTGETCTGALSTAQTGSCSITFLSGGLRTLIASYPGDTNFAPSASVAASQTVGSVSLSSTSLVFGQQVVGTTSAAQTITMTNVGTTTITISSIAWSANFSDSNNCGNSLAPGASCRINVRFRPTTSGVLSGTLTITDSDITSPQIVVLTGTGLQPSATLTPTSNNFGPITRRTQSTPAAFTLTNQTTTFGATMTINSISLGGANPGQFVITSNTCGATLAMGSSCTINVAFAPQQRGNFTATLTVRDNASGSPQTATLSGSGQ